MVSHPETALSGLPHGLERPILEAMPVIDRCFRRQWREHEARCVRAPMTYGAIARLAMLWTALELETMTKAA